MESWRHLIWIKRLSPIIVIVLLWQGYGWYNRIQTERQEQLDHKHALATAHIWLATARFRDNPEQYVVFRDSVLSASGLSTEQMFAYLERNRDHPEKYHPFSEAVKTYVDSLYQIEDSLRVEKEAELLLADSTISE
jgi:hypothetical protein